MVEMGQLVAHGLVASVSYRPNLPSDTLPRRAAYFSDGTTLGYRCWPPPWPRCAACALLKTRNQFLRKTRNQFHESVLFSINLLYAPLTIPLVYCHINSFQRASSLARPLPGGEKRTARRASHHEEL